MRGEEEEESKNGKKWWWWGEEVIQEMSEGKSRERTTEREDFEGTGC